MFSTDVGKPPRCEARWEGQYPQFEYDAMSRRQRKIEMIERLWFARFGEPPSLRTDPVLMQRILDSAGPKPEPDTANSSSG
jgi:hypothetical protein